MRPLWRFVDYFMPNEQEAATITGCKDVNHAALAMIKKGVRHVFVKRGPTGVYCLSDGQSVGDTLSPWSPQRIEDSTGAGDAWCAGFLAAICRGAGDDLVQAARVGNATASFCVERMGATEGIPYLEDVFARMRVRYKE